MNSDKIHDIQDFWTRSPETYADDSHGGTQFDGKRVEFGTREFFENVDRKFIDERPHMHTDKPFGAIFPFDRYASARVFEIGCGMGTMAMQWAKKGCSYTAVDLSPMSIKMTARRFQLFGYDGTFVLGDARHLPFADATFDFGYSWGVLHHSPNLAQSLHEMMRVIRKGGEFAIMLYCRNSVLYRYFIQFRQGFLNYEANFLGPLELASRYTDDFAKEGNPHTWPIIEEEVRAMLAGHAVNLRFWRHGSDIPTHFAFVVPVLGSRLPAWAVRPWIRRYGWSLCFSGVRR